MIVLSRLKSALRLLPRSSVTYATSAPSTSNLSTAKENQSAVLHLPQHLYRRIFHVRDQTHPVVTILEQWVQDGQTLSYDKLLFVIKQLRSRKRYKDALEVSFWMSEKGYSEPRSGDFSIRLDLIAKVKGIEEAESYFDSIPTDLRAAECYSSLLNCYAQVRDVDKAERIMLQMKHLGFARSTMARNPLLNLYYQTQNYDKVENLLLEMKEEGIKFDRFTFATLINTYAAKSDIEGIDKHLAQLEDDSSYSQHADWWSVYAVAANSYGKLGLHDKAFNALKKSEERASSTIWKEAFPYLMTQYATIGKKEEVMRLWNIYKMDGKLLKSDYYSAVINSFLKLDDIELAKIIFDEWESRNRHRPATAAVATSSFGVTVATSSFGVTVATSFPSIVQPPFVLRNHRHRSRLLPPSRSYCPAGANSVPPVNFLAKLVALKPGDTVLGMIRNVMQGKDEGDDNAGNVDEGNAERVSVTGRKSHPGILCSSHLPLLSITGHHRRAPVEAKPLSSPPVPPPPVATPPPPAPASILASAQPHRISHKSFQFIKRFSFFATPKLPSQSSATSSLLTVKKEQSSVVSVPRTPFFQKLPLRDLYRRIFTAPESPSLVVPIIEKWIRDGGTVNYNRLLSVIRKLRSRRRYRNALEVSTWMFEKGFSKHKSGDLAIRLDLIGKVNGLEEAEFYFNSIPKYLRTGECYSSLLNCCAHARDVGSAERIMEKMRALGFARSILSRNVLLNLYYQTQNYDKLENLPIVIGNKDSLIKLLMS
ncbi:hypothetical protein AHAS_Ahas02G0253700 [Arachis hypogaea]